jgi:hypothetical protein
MDEKEFKQLVDNLESVHQGCLRLLQNWDNLTGPQRLWVKALLDAQRENSRKVDEEANRRGLGLN